MNRNFLDKFTDYIYHSFLKPRNVYCLLPGSVIKNDNTADNNIRVTEKNTGGYVHYYFEMIDKDSGEQLGSTNLAVNYLDVLLWHDNYPIRKNDGLIFGSMVSENHRGRGLYEKMLNYVTDYVKGKKVDRLFAVVEARNGASAKSHSKSGYEVCSRNYLIKFFKRNVFTVFIKPVRCYFAGKKSNSI